MLILLLFGVACSSWTLPRIVNSEWLTVVDGRNYPVGTNMQRAWVHRIGLWHRVVRIWVTDSMNRVVIQRRAANKLVAPCAWGPSAEGHVGAGESNEVAAMRELKEELGISFDSLTLVSILRKVDPYNMIDNREFVYVYHVSVDNLLDYAWNSDSEVAELAWLPFSDAYTDNPTMHTLYSAESACKGRLTAWEPGSSGAMSRIAARLPNSITVPETIELTYGTVTVWDPVMLDILHTPAMQRLHHVNQLGFEPFRGDPLAYTRFQHSWGVWDIARRLNGLEEVQVAAATHDVSHTAGSHLADRLYQGERVNEPAFQDQVHGEYIATTTLGSVFETHHIPMRVTELFDYPLLKQPRWEVSADNLEYILYESVGRDKMRASDARKLLAGMSFVDGHIQFDNEDYAWIMAMAALEFTEWGWGNYKQRLPQWLLISGIRRLMAMNQLTDEEFQHGIGADIWKALQKSSDPTIREIMALYKVSDSAQEIWNPLTSPQGPDAVICSKFRGVDPRVGSERLSELDSEFGKEFDNTRLRMQSGWKMIWTPEYKERILRVLTVNVPIVSCL